MKVKFEMAEGHMAADLVDVCLSDVEQCFRSALCGSIVRSRQPPTIQTFTITEHLTAHNNCRCCRTVMKYWLIPGCFLFFIILF